MPPACHDKPVPTPFDGLAYPIEGDTVPTAGGGPHLWGIQAPKLRGKDKQETMPGMRARSILDAWISRASLLFIGIQPAHNKGSLTFVPFLGKGRRKQV